ncbi:hypothetical protein AAG906_025955 [Vitis piasezkii]
MIMRSLQPRFARHLMGFPHVDFGSLVQALYGIEKGIARGLWPDSSILDSNGKKPTIGQRSRNVSAISATDRGPLDIIRQLGRLSEFIIRHHPMMDLHCAYHRGPGHDIDHCTSLRHAIQDLIDQVPPPADGIHFMDFTKLDDHIHMLSWDESVSEPIVANGIYEVGGQSPITARPLEDAASNEEVRRDDDEILRQL